MMKNVLIVANFNAGRKKAVKLKKQVIEFVLRYTKSFKIISIDDFDKTDFSKYDTVLAIGGDGTVNRLIPYLIDTDKVLGIIPCGTANLLAAKLGFSSKLNKNLQIIEQNCVKKLDTLDICGKKIILRCGFGYDSDIICKTPQSLKNKFGYFAYFIAGILFALRLKIKEYKMLINNERHNIQASCVIIANSANMYRNIFSVANNSEPDDGLIDIFILKTTSPILFFLEFLKIIIGIKRSNKLADYMKARSIHIENSWTCCHIDGEKINLKGNIDIAIREKSIKVFCKQ